MLPFQRGFAHEGKEGGTVLPAEDIAYAKILK